MLCPQVIKGIERKEVMNRIRLDDEIEDRTRIRRKFRESIYPM